MSVLAYRPRITAPDGRQFRGRYPQDLDHKGESPYIAALAREVRGIVEVILPAGRADVATDNTVYEVEPVRSWRHGAQQAYAYSAMSGLQPGLALFGPAEYLEIYLAVRDKMPNMTLWIWRGHWERTTSRASANKVVRAKQYKEPGV